MALSKRQPSGFELEKELSEKLEEFVIPTDSLEEVFENREQIEISKFYERLPNRTALPLRSFKTSPAHCRCRGDAKATTKPNPLAMSLANADHST